ncbi:hypothetical protein K488DRAFT_89543 [Vararia minispora EC-137]|uniref:Uncharacterized protein n=1 Tax=Vararia minispora EC-137 TaxID=1314806 RepID=A0ACB8QAL4_9AGAM|nr:hypothetical protein K488DRAFT_89543 [Vararia minispora EC-137]
MRIKRHKSSPSTSATTSAQPMSESLHVADKAGTTAPTTPKYWALEYSQAMRGILYRHLESDTRLSQSELDELFALHVAVTAGVIKTPDASMDLGNAPELSTVQKSAVTDNGGIGDNWCRKRVFRATFEIEEKHSRDTPKAPTLYSEHLSAVIAIDTAPFLSRLPPSPFIRAFCFIPLRSSSVIRASCTFIAWIYHFNSTLVTRISHFSPALVARTFKYASAAQISPTGISRTTFFCIIELIITCAPAP